MTRASFRISSLLMTHQSAPPLVPSPAQQEVGSVKHRRFSHTTSEQRRCMVEWLELPGRFQLMTQGRAAAPLMAGKRVKKTDGYRELMRYVNKRVASEWTQETARSRFESLLASYRRYKARGQRCADPVAASAVAREHAIEMQQCYRRIDALFVMVSPEPVLHTSRARHDAIPASPGSHANQPADAPRRPSDSECSCVANLRCELKLERARLELLQKQLVAKQQELTAREQALRTEQEARMEVVRTSVIAQLVEMGKSAEEVQQYLSAMFRGNDNMKLSNA